VTYTVTINLYDDLASVYRDVTNVHVEEGVAVLTLESKGYVIVPLTAFSTITQLPNRRT
jgi:hypothetical protein